jgi:hypothetical protein
VRNVLAAKAEIDKIVELKERTGGFTGRFRTCDDDIDDLAGRFSGKPGYIFTDPPHGGHISYLDLSMLWKVWLGRSEFEDQRRHARAMRRKGAEEGCRCWVARRSARLRMFVILLSKKRHH